MSDDLEDHLASMAGLWAKSDSERQLLLGRIDELVATCEELEARLEKAVGSLTVIDALDPEGFVNGCSQSALIGLVSRMGAIARTTLAELKGKDT